MIHSLVNNYKKVMIALCFLIKMVENNNLKVENLLNSFMFK